MLMDEADGSVQGYRSAVGLDLAGNDAHQRRFARSVFADQPDDFPRLDAERDIIDCDRVAEGFANAGQMQRHPEQSEGSQISVLVRILRSFVVFATQDDGVLSLTRRMKLPTSSGS